MATGLNVVKTLLDDGAGGFTEAVPAAAPYDLAASSLVLAGIDPALGRVAAALPPLERRTCPSGVAGLAWMIVGQQVSTTSARVVWSKLEAIVGVVDGASLAALTDDAYRGCGFSRPKASYVRALAEAAPDFDALKDLSDADAVAALTQLRGVGPWTAEAYLMLGEGRADFLPSADIALQEAVRWLDGLPHRPDAVETARIAQRWSPHRSTAAHILWAWYVAVKAGEAPHPLKLISEVA